MKSLKSIITPDKVSDLENAVENDTVFGEIQKVKDKLESQIDDNNKTIVKINATMDKLDGLRETVGLRNEKYREMKDKLEELL